MECQERNATSVPSSCLELMNDSVLEILVALSPNCERGAWTPISSEWLAFFYVKVVSFSLLFLLLGIVCVVMVFKRHIAQRFKAKTFIAIDVSLSILGFSRFLLYLLDPYNISGYCGMDCMVVSRLLFALGFPSLTAAYTLVFLTLWYSAKMRLGRNCIQHWKIIIPLCFIHYFVAVVVEGIGAFGSYSLVFLLLSCEAVFSLWGLFVCVTFLFAGCRLLHSIKRSARQTSVVSRDIAPANTEDDPNKDLRSRTYRVMRMKRQMKRHHKQAIRKITIITNITAILGGCYSVLTLIQLVMVSLQLFGPCPDEESGQYHTSSDIWLALKYLGTIIEFLLGLLLVYSVNDIRPFLKWFTECFSTSSVDKERNQKDSVRNRFTYSCSESTEAYKSQGNQTTIISRESSPTTTIVTHFDSEKSIPEKIHKINVTDNDNNNGAVKSVKDDVSSETSIQKSEIVITSDNCQTNC